MSTTAAAVPNDALTRLVSGIGIFAVFLLGPLLVTAPIALSIGATVSSAVSEPIGFEPALSLLETAYKVGLWPAALTGVTAALIWRDLRKGSHFVLACAAAGFVSSAIAGTILVSLEWGWDLTNLLAGLYAGAFGFAAALICGLIVVRWRHPSFIGRALRRRALMVLFAATVLTVAIIGFRVMRDRQNAELSAAINPSHCVTGQLRLSTLTRFRWDEVVIVTPYNYKEDVERVLGHPWNYPGFAGVDIEQDELIFLRRGRVVRSVLQGGASSELGVQGPIRLNVADAVFTCAKDRGGRLSLTLK